MWNHLEERIEVVMGVQEINSWLDYAIIGCVYVVFGLVIIKLLKTLKKKKDDDDDNMFV